MSTRTIRTKAHVYGHLALNRSSYRGVIVDEWQMEAADGCPFDHALLNDSQRAVVVRNSNEIPEHWDGRYCRAEGHLLETCREVNGELEVDLGIHLSQLTPVKE